MGLRFVSPFIMCFDHYLICRGVFKKNYFDQGSNPGPPPCHGGVITI